MEKKFYEIIFYEDLYEIPQDTTHLTFWYEFNQPILKGMIPESVTHIYLSNSFNQPISIDIFPKNLIYIQFGYGFNQPLPDELISRVYTKMVVSLYDTKYYDCERYNLINYCKFYNILDSDNSFKYENTDFTRGEPEMFSQFFIWINGVGDWDGLIEEPYDYLDKKVNILMKKHDWINNRLKNIHQELIQTFYHHQRIQRIADIYHIDFFQVIQIYV